MMLHQTVPASPIQQQFPIRIHELLDEEKTAIAIRTMRWSGGVYCTRCNSNNVKKNGTSHRSPLL